MALFSTKTNRGNNFKSKAKVDSANQKDDVTVQQSTSGESHRIEQIRSNVQPFYQFSDAYQQLIRKA